MAEIFNEPLESRPTSYNYLAWRDFLYRPDMAATTILPDDVDQVLDGLDAMGQSAALQDNPAEYCQWAEHLGGFVAEIGQRSDVTVDLYSRQIEFYCHGATAGIDQARDKLGELLEQSPTGLITLVESLASHDQPADEWIDRYATDLDQTARAWLSYAMIKKADTDLKLGKLPTGVTSAIANFLEGRLSDDSVFELAPTIWQFGSADLKKAVLNVHDTALLNLVEHGLTIKQMHNLLEFTQAVNAYSDPKIELTTKRYLTEFALEQATNYPDPTPASMCKISLLAASGADVTEVWQEIRNITEHTKSGAPTQIIHDKLLLTAANVYANHHANDSAAWAISGLTDPQQYLEAAQHFVDQNGEVGTLYQIIDLVEFSDNVRFHQLTAGIMADLAAKHYDFALTELSYLLVRQKAQASEPNQIVNSFVVRVAAEVAKHQPVSLRKSGQHLLNLAPPCPELYEIMVRCRVPQAYEQYSNLLINNSTKPNVYFKDYARALLAAQQSEATSTS